MKAIGMLFLVIAIIAQTMGCAHNKNAELPDATTAQASFELPPVMMGDDVVCIDMTPFKIGPIRYAGYTLITRQMVRHQTAIYKWEMEKRGIKSYTIATTGSIALGEYSATGIIKNGAGETVLRSKIAMHITEWEGKGHSCFSINFQFTKP